MGTNATYRINGKNYYKHYDGYMGGVALMMIENIKENNGKLDLPNHPKFELCTYDTFKIGHTYGENYHYDFDGDNVKVIKIQYVEVFDNAINDSRYEKRLVEVYNGSILNFMNVEAEKLRIEIENMGENLFEDGESINDIKMVMISDGIYKSLATILSEM